MKRILLFLLLLSITGTVLAQKGKITGTVLDTDFGDVLIGASIKVEGTNMGTITDFDGNYSISLAPGTYSITCSYISYATQTVKEIEVKSGEVAKIDFAMNPAALGLEEVEVVARKRENNEVSLIAMQRKSPIVLDGISSDLISKTGDSDAAGALKRVTGISVEGGKYVYVRGLSDRYSKTLLNGADLPSLDPERNTVQMDMFPSNIIENIVVKKTFSPELPGNFSGGLVDLKTKDFPSKFNMKVSATLEYNPQANLIDDFLYYQGGSTDWLGMDDGTRAIPTEAVGGVPSVYADIEEVNRISKSFNTRMYPLKKSSPLNQSYSFGLGNMSSLFGKDFGYNIGAAYKRKFHHFDNGIMEVYYHPGGEANVLTKMRTTDIYAKSTEETIWSLLMNGNLKLNKSHKVGLTMMANHSGEDEVKFSHGPYPAQDPGLETTVREMLWVERSMLVGQLSGEHYFEPLFNTKFNWLGSYTYSQQDEPDYRHFTNSYFPNDNNYDIEKAIYNDPLRYYREMDESNITLKGDFETPFTLNGNKGALKYGGGFIRKERFFREKKYTYKISRVGYHGVDEDFWAEDNITASRGDHGIEGIYLTNDCQNDTSNCYDGFETVSSGYGMVDYALTKEFRLLTGGRVENTYNLTDRLLLEDQERKPEDRAKIEKISFLPALNLTWNPNDTMIVRLAYSRTIARPTFRELAPFATEDFHRDAKVLGNPELQITTINNIDLRWEYYFSLLDMVSASVFYKKFINPIEQTFNIANENPEITWRNVDQALLYGFELELRKNLEFIHFLLRHYRIGANFTLVESYTMIDTGELAVKRDILGQDQPDKRVMFGQAPIVVNIFGGYSNPDRGLDINLVFNYNGKRLAVVNTSGPDIFEMPRGVLDANISKGIGENWKVKFTVKNILDTETKQIYEYSGKEYRYLSYTRGRLFKFGVSYTID